MVTIVLASSLLNILNRVPRWMEPSQDFLLVASNLLLFVASKCSSLRKGRATHVLFAIIMVGVSLWVPLGKTLSDTVLINVLSSWILRLPWSLSQLDVGMVAFWNTVCSVANCWKFVHVEVQSSSNMSPRTLIYFEVVMVSLNLVLSCSFRKATLREVYQEIEASARKIDQSAMTMLLEMVCDVVLSLDANLQLLEDTPRFAAMLMLESTRSLKGMKLESFMSSEVDQKRFQSQLLSSSFGKDFASRALNVNIRESSGSSFTVEVLSVPFQGLDNAKYYMVGIREVTDMQPTPLKSSVGLDSPAKELEICSKSRRERSTLGTPSTSHGNTIARQERHAPEDGLPAPCEEAKVLAEGADILDHQSSTGSVSSSGMVLIHPDLKETGAQAKRITFCETLSAWNIQIPRRSCCSFHAAQHEAKAVLRALRSSTCIKNFHDSSALGCWRCGILDRIDETNTCTVCGYAPQCNAGISL